MLISPHTHPESQLTGSTLKFMVDRAKELGRTHFAVTDQGHLASIMKAYSFCKADPKSDKACLKNSLQLIPGIEIFFKDPSCPIIERTSINRCKYFNLTLYCQDQIAFQELCRIVSRVDLPTIEVRDQKCQLWGWKELEQISKFNTIVSLGTPHCMVSKPMLAGRADLGEMVLNNLKGLFLNRIYASLVCEPWTKKYYQVIETKLGDGSSISMMTTDLVATDRARRIKAIDLVEKPGHTFLKSTFSGNIFNKIDLPIVSAKLHKGFLPFPGGDVTKKVNLFLRALCKKHNIPLLATDYAYYAQKEDKVVQTMVLEGNDKLQPNFHMKEGSEIVAYLCGTLGLPTEETDSILRNNEQFAHLFDTFKLEYEWRLADTGGNPIAQVMDIIQSNGRMRWDDPLWTARLKEELEVIAKNGTKDLTGYFLPIRGVLNHYKESGRLTGPGRGSSGSSLLCYLLGITQINPIKYDLPFSRFFSLDRVAIGEWPDIDVDLESRELLVGEDGKSGYLYGKYGDKAAQISTRTTVRLKSAIKDTNRYFMGKVEGEIETLTEGLPAPPQGISDNDFLFGFDDKDNDNIHVPGIVEQSEELQAYIKSRPREWAVVRKAMGISRSMSRHASAFILADVPIRDVIPTKDGNITQYEAKQVEAAKLIKYDFLVVSQLKDIRICLDLINKKNRESNIVGNFTHNGKLTYIWDLPENLEVFRSIWGGACESMFQINTRSMVPFVKDILPRSMMDLATILALVRPGTLDFIDPNTGRNMAEEYVLRRNGESEPDIKELYDLLPETQGILCFQESLPKIGRKLAGFSGSQAEMLRKHMAKKNMSELMKLKPSFIEGARTKVPVATAEAIWERMVTFGRYGFSIIHSVEYAHITYACMFLKHFYPLEWWAAVLTNADEKEVTGTFWPFIKDKVAPPDINLSSDTMEVDYSTGKIRAKLGVIRGIGNATIEPIVSNRPYRDIIDFVNKDVAGDSLTCKLIHVGILDSLFPRNLDLYGKLKAYKDAVEVKSFKDKVRKATENGKKIRQLQPKEGTVPSEYIGLTPLKDAAMRKSVLPTLPIDLHSIGKQSSKAIKVREPRPMVESLSGHDTFLVDGNQLQKIDEIPANIIDKDIYVAATCFVIETKEFSYAKGAKRALKLILDSDGYISEKVLWPDYNTNELSYPKDLKKGCIATIFFKKRPGPRPDLSVTGVVVET